MVALPRRRPVRRASLTTTVLMVVVVCCVMLFDDSSSTTCCHALEAKWTPAESEDQQGPLPLSSNQRQQLLQLEQAIRNSPDPQATLEQVAASNSMDPQELINLLQRNHADMTSDAMPQRQRHQNVLFKAVTAVIGSATHMAKIHPKETGIVVISLVTALYVSMQVQRNGLTVSNRRSLVSNGPSTIFAPPSVYIQNVVLGRLLDNSNCELSVAKTSLYKQIPSVDALLEDGVTWHTKTKEYKTAVTAQTTLSGKQVDWSLEHATKVLSHRDLCEWVETMDCYHDSSPDEGGTEFVVFVVSGLGDYGRYGLLQFQVTRESDSHLVLTALKKQSHFDGQIAITIVENEDESVAVRVGLIVPPKGKRLKKRLAEMLVENLARSVAASIETRTRQSIARSQQSTQYAAAARVRATERRRTRAQQEREMEEMAADRRRRWQRSNPNSGNYRPSGDRMKSPNNAVY
jgi:hypothetical protein